MESNHSIKSFKSTKYQQFLISADNEMRCSCLDKQKDTEVVKLQMEYDVDEYVMMKKYGERRIFIANLHPGMASMKVVEDSHGVDMALLKKLYNINRAALDNKYTDLHALLSKMYSNKMIILGILVDDAKYVCEANDTIYDGDTELEGADRSGIIDEDQYGILEGSEKKEDSSECCDD